MKKIVDWFRNRTATELFLLGTVIILIILIFIRWEWVYQEVSESLSRLFRTAPAET
ncbi:MAG: hypothetical protein PHT92_08145 [Bacteroidales bacterium]|nr:hypothetical protein [Bacteroidales bacterium]